MTDVEQDFVLGERITGYPQPYALLRYALTLAQPGTALEFGVGAGHSLRIIAAAMPVIGFDSFTGLPEDWRPGFPKGTFAHPPPIVTNSRLVVGAFADTLPTFDFAAAEPITLVHFDADLYSSTLTALNYVGPHLKPDAIVVFDEFHSYPGWRDHEARAWREHTAAHPELGWEVLGHDVEQLAIRIT